MARTVFTALVLIGCAIAAGGVGIAASPLDIQRSLEAEVRQSTYGFTGFSRGSRELVSANYAVKMVSRGGIEPPTP